MRRSLLITIIAAILLSGLPQSLRAQPFVPRYTPPYVGSADGRLSVEAFFSRSRPRGSEQERSLDGVGGRVLWSMAPRASRSLAARTSVGGFLTYASDAQSERRSWHYGVELDARPFARPIATRFEPLLTLGIGGMRTVSMRGRSAVVPLYPYWWLDGDATETAPASAATPTPLRGLPPRTETSFALTPGMGLKIHLAPGLAVRTDVRQALLFRGPTDHRLELAVGVSLTR